MSTSFNSPYRGLPAEIRLQIWKLTIPERVTVLREFPNGPSPTEGLDSNDNRLTRSPSLQIQLLRLNKEVYSEVLSVLKKVEIGLGIRSFKSLEIVWPKLSLAMQSPAFSTLTYLWNGMGPEGREYECILPRLLVQSSSGTLACLNMFLRKSATGNMTEIRPPGWSEDSEIWWIQGHVALPALAAAVLQQRKFEVISIKIKQIKSTDMHLWSEASVRESMTAHPQGLINMFPRRSQAFRQFISEHAGVIDVSDIQITSEFFETSERGIYRGKVKFTKVLNGSKKA